MFHLWTSHCEWHWFIIFFVGGKPLKGTYRKTCSTICLHDKLFISSRFLLFYFATANLHCMKAILSVHCEHVAWWFVFTLILCPVSCFIFQSIPSAWATLLYLIFQIRKLKWFQIHVFKAFMLVFLNLKFYIFFLIV